MRSLRSRGKDGLVAPDKKGYAERRAELLFHMGCCKYESTTLGGPKKAVENWREAKKAIVDAWPKRDSKRACEGQYWMSFKFRHKGKKRSVAEILGD